MSLHLPRYYGSDGDNVDELSAAVWSKWNTFNVGHGFSQDERSVETGCAPVRMEGIRTRSQLFGIAESPSAEPFAPMAGTHRCAAH
jgi:hypothetical protein